MDFIMKTSIAIALICGLDSVLVTAFLRIF